MQKLKEFLKKNSSDLKTLQIMLLEIVLFLLMLVVLVYQLIKIVRK